MTSGLKLSRSSSKLGSGVRRDRRIADQHRKAQHVSGGHRRPRCVSRSAGQLHRTRPSNPGKFVGRGFGAGRTRLLDRGRSGCLAAMTDRTPVPEPHATTNNVNQQHQSVTTSDGHAQEEECHVSSIGELKHFTDVYRGSLDRLFALVSQIESLEAYEGLLIDAPSNYFFNHAVTVENLVRHLVAAESHWLALLPDLPIGEPVTLPSDIIVTDEFERDHVETFYLSRIEDASSSCLTCRPSVWMRKSHSGARPTASRAFCGCSSFTTPTTMARLSC